jgi:hypothetical protein
MRRGDAGAGRLIEAVVTASKAGLDVHAVPPGIDRLFRISTVATILDISRQAVFAHVKDGTLPALKIFDTHTPASSTPDDPRVPRGAWRIRESVLQDYLRRCEARR